MSSFAFSDGFSGQLSSSPETEAPCGSSANGPAAGSDRTKVGRPLGVLLVEDEVIVAWDIAETLKRLGYAIVGMADTAEQALRLAETVAPDLILMDIRLNGTHDGIEAARMIRNSTGLGVVYLTAHADLATMERAAATEPLGYVFKPFSQEVLRTALARATGRRTAAAGN
jgi:AmiR/NasT family two-component response regulator